VNLVITSDEGSSFSSKKLIGNGFVLGKSCVRNNDDPMKMVLFSTIMTAKKPNVLSESSAYRGESTNPNLLRDPLRSHKFFAIQKCELPLTSKIAVKVYDPHHYHNHPHSSVVYFLTTRETSALSPLVLQRDG
jgi:hypothetical protein